MNRKKKRTKITVSRPANKVRISAEYKDESALRSVARGIIEIARQELRWEGLLAGLKKDYPATQVYEEVKTTGYALHGEPFIILQAGYPVYRVSHAADELPPVPPDTDYWTVDNKCIAGWRVLRSSDADQWLEVGLRAASVVESEVKADDDRQGSAA